MNEQEDLAGEADRRMAGAAAAAEAAGAAAASARAEAKKEAASKTAAAAEAKAKAVQPATWRRFSPGYGGGGGSGGVEDIFFSSGRGGGVAGGSRNFFPPVLGDFERTSPQLLLLAHNHPSPITHHRVLFKRVFRFTVIAWRTGYTDGVWQLLSLFFLIQSMPSIK